MPIIRLVNPVKGDLVHFYRDNKLCIEGPFRVVEVGVTAENIHTRKELLWPLGLPCTVEPSGITTERRIEVIDEREVEYEAS